MLKRFFRWFVVRIRLLNVAGWHWWPRHRKVEPR
jgi:hypothetical protein